MVKEADPSQNDLLRSSALRDILNLHLAGWGVGAAARGASGLYNLFSRSQRPRPDTGLGPIQTEIPIREKKKKKKDLFKLSRDKTAEGEASWFMGGKADTKTGIPYYLPTSLAAGGSGLYGGWKLMDMILDRRRTKAQEDEMEDARSDFYQALSGGGPKQAADGPTLGQDLDTLFDLLTEKQAFYNISGQAAGAYLAYGGISGLMAGLYTYEQTKKRRKRELLEKAVKDRKRKAFERRPPSIEAIPMFTRQEPKAPEAISA